MARVKTHPGQILLREFIIPRLAEDIEAKTSALEEFIDGKRGLTDNLAIKLSRKFENTTNFWWNLENKHNNSKLSNQIEPGSQPTSPSARIEPGRVEIIRERYEVTVTKICLSKTSTLFCSRPLAEEYLVAMAKKDHVKYVELKTHILSEQP